MFYRWLTLIESISFFTTQISFSADSWCLANALSFVFFNHQNIYFICEETIVLMLQFFVMIFEQVELHFVPFQEFNLFFEFCYDDLFLIFFDCQRWINCVLGRWVFFTAFWQAHLWESGAFAWSHVDERENELIRYEIFYVGFKINNYFLIDLLW